MVIDYFNFIDIPIPPFEANSPLLVDANTILTCTVSFQRLQFITGRYSQILKLSRSVKVHEFAPGRIFNTLKSQHFSIVKKRLSVFTLESFNQFSPN